jgi:hypothetical protein
VRVIALQREEIESARLDLLSPSPSPATEPSNDVAARIDAAFQQARIGESIALPPIRPDFAPDGGDEADTVALQRMKRAHRVAIVILALAAALLIVALLSR